MVDDVDDEERHGQVFLDSGLTCCYMQSCDSFHRLINRLSISTLPSLRKQTSKYRARWNAARRNSPDLWVGEPGRRCQLLVSIGAGTPPDLFVLLGHPPRTSGTQISTASYRLSARYLLFLIGAEELLSLSLVNS